MCLTPVRLATASSTILVTWVSSSAGAAPAWVTVTVTTGTSMLGNLVTGRRMKLSVPSSASTANSSTGVTGFLIDQAEMLRRITGSR